MIINIKQIGKFEGFAAEIDWTNYEQSGQAHMIFHRINSVYGVNGNPGTVMTIDELHWSLITGILWFESAEHLVKRERKKGSTVFMLE